MARQKPGPKLTEEQIAALLGEGPAETFPLRVPNDKEREELTNLYLRYLIVEQCASALRNTAETVTGELRESARKNREAASANRDLLLDRWVRITASYELSACQEIKGAAYARYSKAMTKMLTEVWTWKLD